MRLLRYAFVVAVLAAALAGTQLAYTDVGNEVSDEWSTPVAIDELDERAVTSVAVDGGDDDAVVAWIVDADGEWIVERATLRSEDGTARVIDAERVHRSETRLDHVDVTASEGEWVLAWRDRDAGDIAVAGAGTDDGVETIRTDDRVRYPSVATTDDGIALAWAERSDGFYRLQYGLLHERGLERVTTDRRTGGMDSPSVDADGDRIVVAWLDPDRRAATVAFGTSSPSGVALESPVEVGDARENPEYTRAGYNVDVALDDGTAHVVWYDLSTSMYGTVRPDGETTTSGLSSGDRPAVAASDGHSLSGWIEKGNPGNAYDVRYRGSIDGDAVEGPVTLTGRSSQNAGPFFAGDPGFVWTERGSGFELRASVLLEEPRSEVLPRLVGSTPELAFFSAVALAIGALTAPVLPWVWVGFLGTFAVTSEVVSDRIVRLLVPLGAGADGAAVRDRLEAVPTLAWGAAFAAAVTAVLYWLVATGATPGLLAFERPIVVSAVAFVATSLAALALGGRLLESIWHYGAAFAAIQTSLLWATILPRYLS